jgi:acetyl esterase/lipase
MAAPQLEAIKPQAIDPDILPRLDPEYVAFHNKYVAHLVPPHTLPWNPAIRNGDTVPGSAEVLSVGSVQDYDLSHCKVRVFTPEGTPPPDGWPAYIWYHGGEFEAPFNINDIQAVL